MKIATKITLGYSILIALMVTLLVYHVSSMRRMESVQRDLSEGHFHAALSFLQLLRNLDQIEEYTQKFFVKGDSRYGAKLKGMHESFGQDLQQLQILSLTFAVGRDIDCEVIYFQSGCSKSLHYSFNCLRPSQLCFASAVSMRGGGCWGSSRFSFCSNRYWSKLGWV